MTDAALQQAAQKLEAAGIEAGRFEAQLLLAHVLDVSRTAILAGLHPEPTAEQWSTFRHLIGQRTQRVPLAYLRGTQEFYGLTFEVTPAVLIPRPETELLVEFALEKLQIAPTPRKRAGGIVVADVGTGSGCIAVATLVHCPGVFAVGLDISADALAVARRNAVRNRVADRLRFVQADLLSAAARERFALVASNPPYIPGAEIPTLQIEVRAYEPRRALDGGADGLSALRGLALSAQRALLPDGWLAVEVAMGQAELVRNLFQAHGYADVTTRRDLAGIERMVCGRKISSP